MRPRSRVAVVLASPLLAASVLSATGASQQVEPAQPAEKNESQPIFIGTAACKPCHFAKNAGGQFTIWKDSPHSKAHETLASPKAKEVASARGIEDPHKAPACLKCHVAGLGEPPERFGPKFRIEDGVQCENCHGAGGDYYPKEIMIDRELATSKGMIIGDEALCRTCHNKESPTYKEFHFDEFWKRIAHPVPEERKQANRESLEGRDKPEKHDR